MPTDFPTPQQMHAFEHFIGSIVSALPRLALFAVLVGLGVVICVALLTLTLRLLSIRRLLGQKVVFLELTPPSFSDKAPVATQQLFTVLHGLEETRAAMDKVLQRSVTFALEIVSTREHGIRFIVCVPKKLQSTFEKYVVSYVSDARLQQVEDYLPEDQNMTFVRVLDFKQTGHFAYPLKLDVRPDEHDSVAYLTGIMTSLAKGEIMSLQFVLSPAKVRKANRMAGNVLHNEELFHHLGKKRQFSMRPVLGGINSVLFAFTDAVGEVSHGPSRYNGSNPRQGIIQHQQQAAMRIKPARTLSQFEQQLGQSVYDKLSQPLFRVNIRALIMANDKQRVLSRANDVRQSLASFSVPRYQSLRARNNFPYSLMMAFRLFMFRHRLPAVFNGNSSLLASSEVAAMYHFPHSETARTENVVKSLSRTLPAPIGIKQHADNGGFDVVLGRSRHHGKDTSIGLTSSERERHVYVLGGTGNGKTTMLKYAIVQDIKNGKGVGVVDPHGDLAEELLRQIPEDRIKDVVYFNPDDLSYPIGLNVLELTPGLTGDELLREKDLVTESVISIFRKIFSDDDTGGHRIEYVLRNAIQTALTVEGATLFTVYNLLNDPDYCKQVISTLENEDLINFWKNELGKAGGFQQVKMVAGITAKIGRFLFSASAKRILEQPKSTINFDEILDGKILICNFSKGLLGEDTSGLFGVSVLAKIQMAALRRARRKQIDRKPFYLYVDEFQNFATPSFVQMLSEARKYKLLLTMAEQSTSQQADLLTVNVILANVGTVICFRSGNPADERLVLPLFRPFIDEGEIANLPSYNFYMRISAQKTQEPFSGETVLLEDEGSESVAEEVTEASRKQYATKYVPAPKPEKPATPPAKVPKTKAAKKSKARRRPGEKKQ